MAGEIPEIPQKSTCCPVVEWVVQMRHYRKIPAPQSDIDGIFVRTKIIMNIQLRPIAEKDLPGVKAIYDWYIENSTATFHTEPIGIDQLKSFIYLAHPVYRSYLIYQDNEIAGYCFLTKYKDRPAYDRTAEITIYLDPECQGYGIGTAALSQMIAEAREAGLKNLLGIITGGNEASIRLFERSGFQKCAHFKNVGEKFNQVLDVVAYQLEISRQ